MENPNEPKQGVQEQAEELFDKLTTPEEQPQESSPDTEQPNDQREGGSDPLKTPSNVEQEDKGFATHPKWLERENKLKEARESLKSKEQELERYSKLLDDPEVYSKWLKSQGYSDAHIKEQLRAKGYDQEPRGDQKANQAQAIAERACANLGWDINRLNQEQKTYIQDNVRLTMAVIQDTVGPMLEERFGPLEKMSNEMEIQKRFSSEELTVQNLAKEEFPEAGWEEVIKPAIIKYLADLDQKDPKREIKLTYEDIYYRATRPLLKELNEFKGRQEIRDTNKKNLRPLGTGVSSKTTEGVQKGKSARDEAEAFLDSRGVR